MMKTPGVEYTPAATAAALAITAVQMILSRTFTYHIGEISSGTAMSTLFFYVLTRMTRKTAE